MLPEIYHLALKIIQVLLIKIILLIKIFHGNLLILIIRIYLEYLIIHTGHCPNRFKILVNINLINFYFLLEFLTIIRQFVAIFSSCYHQF